LSTINLLFSEAMVNHMISSLGSFFLKQRIESIYRVGQSKTTLQQKKRRSKTGKKSFKDNKYKITRTTSISTTLD
jgi:hypothetical protein